MKPRFRLRVKSRDDGLIWRIETSDYRSSWTRSSASAIQYALDYLSVVTFAKWV